MEQVGRWHRAAREEMRGHPAIFIIVGRCSMSKDMDKQFPCRLESSSHLGHKKLVILHVLEELKKCQQVPEHQPCDWPQLKPHDQSSFSQTHSPPHLQWSHSSFWTPSLWPSGRCRAFGFSNLKKLWPWSLGRSRQNIMPLNPNHIWFPL